MDRWDQISWKTWTKEDTVTSKEDINISKEEMLLNIYKKTEASILNAIESFYLSYQCNEYYRHLNREALVTIKYSGARQSGQTTAMINLSKKMFDNPLTVFLNRLHLNEFIYNKNFESITIDNATYINNLKNFRSKKQFDCICVDAASCLTDRQINDIYHLVYTII